MSLIPTRGLDRGHVCLECGCVSSARCCALLCNARSYPSRVERKSVSMLGLIRSTLGQVFRSIRGVLGQNLIYHVTIPWGEKGEH